MNYCIYCINKSLRSEKTGEPIFRIKLIISNALTLGQLSVTFRFDVLVTYLCRKIRLGIISYEKHLLVTKTKSESIIVFVYFTFLHILKSVTFIFYNIKI